MRPGESAISLISVALFVFASSATPPTPTPTPTPMLPPNVQGVTVTRTVQGSSQAFNVSWSAVSGSGITYVVCYANVFTDPSSYKCVSGITGTSTTLGPLSPGATYRIYIAAVSSGVQGLYTYGRLHMTYQVPSAPTNITALPSTTTLTVRWDDKGFSYRLHVQKKGSTEINPFGPVTPPYNITGLESNTEYTVVVEAYNPLGSTNRSVVVYTLPEVGGEPASTDPTTVEDVATYILIGVLVVVIVMIVAAAVVIIYLLFVYKSQESPPQHLPNDLEDDIEMKASGKGPSIPLVAQSVQSEDSESICDVHIQGVNLSDYSDVHINGLSVSGNSDIHTKGLRVSGNSYVHTKGLSVSGNSDVHTKGLRVSGNSDIHTKGLSVSGNSDVHTKGLSVSGNSYVHTKGVSVLGNSYVHTKGVSVSDNSDVLTKGVSVSDHSNVHTNGVSISDNTDVHTKVMSVSDNSDVHTKVVSVSDNDDVHTKVVSVSDNDDVHTKVVSVSDNDDVHTKVVSVSEHVFTDTEDSTFSQPIPKSQFAAHVRMMHMDEDSGFEKEFETIINDPDGCETVAIANKIKNRYLNIHTYDHSRVVLSVPDENGSDYINASYIDDYRRKNAYIASQGPISTTVGDFWRMVFDHQCPVIVMLTKVVEKGTRKCKKYWPEVLNTATEQGKGIMVTIVNFEIYPDYEVREFITIDTLDESSSPLFVKHFLYTGWPDHGVPQHPASLVKFTQKVRRAYQQSPAPLLVHCSAGVGRTGAYITIDAMMQRMEEKDDLNIHDFVTQMRSKRKFMVHNQDQYVFIHDALADYITCGDTSILVQELSTTMAEMSQVDKQTKKNRFVQQFEFLRTFSKAPSGEDTKFASKHTIARKNRYSDRYPYSTCYLHIPGRSPINCEDYMNASCINSYFQKNAFIAAQSPMNSTLFDFWELIWQLKLTTVVLLCNFVENEQESSVEFWPREKQCGADYGIVRVNHKSTQHYDGYDEQKLEVLDKRKDICTPIIVTVFHFWDWPIDSPPTHLPSLLKVIEEVDYVHKGTTKPLLVACNDGMARTGVFIAAMSEVMRVKAEGEIDLFQTVKAARSKRPHMVSTPEQYELCFKILKAYLDSIDTYEYSKLNLS